MKVLVYTRPRIKNFFHDLVSNIDCFKEVKFFSDHRGTEEIDLMEIYYRYKSLIKLGDRGENIWEALDFDDIHRRCRYLRQLSKEDAAVRIKAMSLAINSLLESENPDYVFGMVMDSYVIDILDRLMRSRGRQYVGFVNNMINGYSRLTARGELIFNRDPDEMVVQEKIKELREKYYVPNMQKDFMWNTSPARMFFTKFIREWIKIVYYEFKKIVDSDSDNFYANTVAARECMACRSISQLFFRKYQETNYKARINKARKEGKVIAYLPLQFYPECSIDYWGTSIELSNFYETVNQLVNIDLKEVLLLVKEHPSAIGLRKIDFYKNLTRNINIVPMPFDISSNEVIEYADVVLTWTGSVGVEAIARRKPLITFGNAYYDNSSRFLQINSYEELNDLENVIKKAFEESKYLDFDKEFKSIIKYMVGGMVEGYIFPLDYGSSKNRRNNQEMSKLAQNISLQMQDIFKAGLVEVRKGCL